MKYLRLVPAIEAVSQYLLDEDQDILNIMFVDIDMV